jgi:hypothetical protein
LGLALDLFEPADLQTRSVHLIDHDAAVIFVSAIGAGWAMGLVSWGCTTPGRTLEIRPEAGQKARPRRATPETAHRGD